MALNMDDLNKMTLEYLTPRLMDSLFKADPLFYSLNKAKASSSSGKLFEFRREPDPVEPVAVLAEYDRQISFTD
jgi:hypothetical protein